MNQLGIDAIIAIVALSLWLVTFLPLRRLVHSIAGRDGQGRFPIAAELLMLAHLAVLIAGLIAGLDFGLELLLVP